MTPQIVSMDYGAHNAVLEESAARIFRGGSWKKQRLVLVIPSADLIPAKVVMYWMNLIYPPNQVVFRTLALGMEVGDAYSTTIGNILSHPELSQFEYLLTMEHDNCPPPDGVIRLIERMEQHPEFCCIGGLYWTKGYGGVPQIWGDPKDHLINFRPQPPIADQLVECQGTGMGFNLWRLGMFKDQKLRRPWFKTLNGREGQGVGTQDLYFWGDARKYGYRCAVDCAVKVGHYDHQSDKMW